jgi:putative membrane protein
MLRPMYTWLLALHLIAVISWMAGLLYLPRLFVYHAATTTGSEQSETFKTMEQRLLRYIMAPAMGATWIFGIGLVLLGHWFTAGWFQVKFVLVLAMTIMHGLMNSWANDFRYDRSTKPQKFFRIANEIPTLLMIAIVILAAVKPF